MAVENCVHYWVIDAKNFGVCKHCGTTKQFQSGDEALSVYHRHKENDEPPQISSFEKPDDKDAAMATALEMVKSKPELAVNHIAKLCKVPPLVSLLLCQER